MATVVERPRAEVQPYDVVLDFDRQECVVLSAVWSGSVLAIWWRVRETGEVGQSLVDMALHPDATIPCVVPDEGDAIVSLMRAFPGATIEGVEG